MRCCDVLPFTKTMPEPSHRHFKLHTTPNCQTYLSMARWPMTSDLAPHRGERFSPNPVPDLQVGDFLNRRSACVRVATTTWLRSIENHLRRECKIAALIVNSRVALKQIAVHDKQYALARPGCDLFHVTRVRAEIEVQAVISVVSL